MIRAVLCDDEPIARRWLIRRLGQITDVEVVGAAEHGRAALDLIMSLRPDLVLLDIEMPGLDGLEVAAELACCCDHEPLIVFTTAYPEFARPAFDTGVIDFLTKPVLMPRLEVAIARVRSALADRTAAARLAELAKQFDALRGGGRMLDADPHVWIHRRGEALRLSLDRIDSVHAEAEYVRIVTREATYLHRESLSDFITRLDPAHYVRIHRSFVVNRANILAVRRRATGSYRLTLRDGTELPVGKSYRRAIRDIAASEAADQS